LRPIRLSAVKRARVAAPDRKGEATTPKGIAEPKVVFRGAGVKLGLDRFLNEHADVASEQAASA